MAPSPARITTTQGPSRNSFEATLRSSDPPKRSTGSTRSSSREKSPTKSPTRSSNRDDYRPGSWRSSRPESQISNTSSKLSAARSTPIESTSSKTTTTTITSKPITQEAKHESKIWEKCGELESSWPKMTSESIVSIEAPLTSATASSLSSSMTSSRSAHRSPSRESEKKVRINLEPMGQQSSYSRSYHSETKTSSSSKHDDRSSPLSGEINTVTTTASSSKEVIECSVEVPEDGWSLKDAIKKKLLNPQSGMFNLPTSRQIVITFREALKCKIINPISADVIDPDRLSSTLSSSKASGSATSSSPINTRPVSLYRALEKGILDERGGYTADTTRSKISLEEAIEKGFVTFDDRVKTSDSLVTRVIKIVRTEGLSPRDEVTLESSPIGSRSSPVRSSIRQNRSVSPSNTTRASSSASASSTSMESKRYQSSGSTSSKTKTSPSPPPTSAGNTKTDSSMTKYEEFVEIGTNIFYCPSSDTVFDEVTGKRTTLAESLASRQIDWAKFSVIDTLTGKPIGLSEAISRKLLDSIKYFVFDAKRGKTYSLSEAVKRGLFILTSSPLLLMESASAASHVTLNPGPNEDSGRPGSGRLVRETVQVLKSREIFIKDPSTGQEVPLEEAVRKGLVDRETAERLKAQEVAASGFSVKRSVDLTVHDPRTGQEIPIDLAVRRGIIDTATADRIRRGEVIENVISTNVTLVDDEQENWSDIVSEINERLDLITEFKAFQQNYTEAKKWLDGIDRRLRSLAADYDDENDLMNIESKRSKVASLKHELTSQSHILSTVDESAESCKARMDRGSIEYSRIERLTRSLHDQYKSCLNSAADLTKRLNDLDQARSKYYQKLATIDQELESISRDLDKLISSTINVNEKEVKLISLESKLTSHRSAIGECEAICDHLCRLLTSSSEQSKARNGLNEIERKYRELHNDIKEVNGNYKDFQSFMTQANEFTKWQSKIETSLKTTINSQQLNQLKDEFERIEEIIKTIQSREVEYEDLIETGNDLICRFESNAPESDTIRSKLATINANWTSIRSSADKQINQLETTLRESSKAKETLRKFNSFLDTIETDYSNLPEISTNQLTNEKTLSFVEKMRSSLDSHHSEYLIVSKLRVTGIDKSVNLIEKEVKESCSRYEKINQETIKKSEQLREMVAKLSSIGSTLKQIGTEIDKFESKIHSSKVMTSTTFDSRLTETTKSLINQSHNLMDKIETSKVKINEMSSGSTGFSSFVNEINNYSEKVKSLNSQLNSRLESIQSASTIVDKIQRKMDKVENQLKQEDIAINRLSTISTDSVVNLEKQRQEVKEIFSESEHLTTNLTELSRILSQEEMTNLGREWETTHRHFVHLIRSMESRHTTNLATLDKRQAAIEVALNEARSFEKKLSEFESWLNETESILEKMEDASYLTETLETQMSENQRLEESIRSKCKLLDDLEKRGTSPKQREVLVAIRHRVNRLTSRCIERSQILDRNLKLAREFVDKWTLLIDWLTETEVALESRSTSSAKSLSSRLIETRNNFKNLLRSFESKRSAYESTMRLGSSLREKSPKGDSPVFQRMLNELSSKWESTLSTITETLSGLETDLNYSEKYSSLVKELSSWLQTNQITTDGLHGDVTTVNKLIKDHSSWFKSFTHQESKLVTIKRLGEQLINNSVGSDETMSIKCEINDLSRAMSELKERSVVKEKKLKESLRKAEQLEAEVNRLVNWLTGIESSVHKMDSSMSLTEERELTKYNETIQSYLGDMEREEVNRDRLIAECQSILLDCHPDAEYTIRHYITNIESKWESVSSLLKTKSSKCKSAYNQLMDKINCLDQLLQWISRAEQELEDMESTPIPDEPSAIQQIIESFEAFRSKVMMKESEFDQVASDYYAGNAVQQQQQSRSSGRSSSRSAILRVKSLEVSLSSLTHPKAIELIGRWQKLVKALNDRLIRLRSKHNYFSELERLRDFDFDAWRRRFLDWMNEKKAKIMDFFRKMDDDHDGKVNYEQFIEGFIKSKFPTTRSEMSKVATIFDRNSDGYIDSKEWMDTLRDKTEAEIIKDEVFRQVAQCTCRDKYKVFQVEERKYRFGESQKLRLVRILRSVVMVRVGGGWVSLNEFLIKNDPCRAKGRTNVELREPLADGVSQSMAAFQPKVTSTPTEGNVIYGPITKIREKTERSMPMSASIDDNSAEDSDDLGELRSRSRSQTRTGASSRASDGLSEDVSLDGHSVQHQHQQHQRMSRIDNKPRWR